MYNHSDPGEVPGITRYHQSDRQDVVTKHLPVIVSAFLGVDDVDLMEPPSELSEIVEFGECWKENDGVGAP